MGIMETETDVLGSTSTEVTATAATTTATAAATEETTTETAPITTTSDVVSGAPLMRYYIVPSRRRPAGVDYILGMSSSSSSASTVTASSSSTLPSGSIPSSNKSSSSLSSSTMLSSDHQDPCFTNNVSNDTDNDPTAFIGMDPILQEFWGRVSSSESIRQALHTAATIQQQQQQQQQPQQLHSSGTSSAGRKAYGYPHLSHLHTATAIGTRASDSAKGPGPASAQEPGLSPQDHSNNNNVDDSLSAPLPRELYLPHESVKRSHLLRHAGQVGCSYTHYIGSIRTLIQPVLYVILIILPPFPCSSPSLPPSLLFPNRLPLFLPPFPPSPFP